MDRGFFYLHAQFYGACSGPPVFEALLRKQAKQLEAECLAEGHAASGIKPRPISSIAKTQRIDRPQKLHLYVYIIKGC